MSADCTCGKPGVCWTHDGPFYSARQACDLAGITYRQLDYSVRAGLLRPIVDAKGSGNHRRFNLDDIVRARAILAMDDGIRRSAAEVINERPARGLIIAVSGNVFWSESGDEIADLITGAGSLVKVLSIDTVRSEVETRLADAATAA